MKWITWLILLIPYYYFSAPISGNRRRKKDWASLLNRIGTSICKRRRCRGTLYSLSLNRMFLGTKPFPLLFIHIIIPCIYLHHVVQFVVRVAKALDKKPSATGGPARELTLSSQDPFMDPEPELTVTVCVCNSTFFYYLQFALIPAFFAFATKTLVLPPSVLFFHKLNNVCIWLQSSQTFSHLTNHTQFCTCLPFSPLFFFIEVTFWSASAAFEQIQCGWFSSSGGHHRVWASNWPHQRCGFRSITSGMNALLCINLCTSSNLI